MWKFLNSSRLAPSHCIVWNNHEVSGDFPAGCKIRHYMDKEMRPAPEEDIFTNLLERMKQKILSLRIRLNFLEQKWQVQFEIASCNFT